MRRYWHKVIATAAAVLLAGGLYAGEGDVLYWMIDDAATVREYGTETYTSIADFLPAETASSWSAARIRVTGGAITGDTFLDLYNPFDGTLESGEFGVAFDDGGFCGYWGAGVPTGNQSPSGAYSAGSPEYCFTVEIGNVIYDESTDSQSWTTLASSQPTGYSQLGDYIRQSFSISVPSSKIWTMRAFVTPVPEPSSGLLALMGFAFLALRRKRCQML